MKLLMENWRMYLTEGTETRNIEVYPGVQDPKTEKLVELTKKVYLKIKKDMIRDVQTNEYQKKLAALLSKRNIELNTIESITQALFETINEFKLIICDDPERCRDPAVRLKKTALAAYDPSHKAIKINIWYPEESQIGKSKVFNYYQLFYHELSHLLDRALNALLTRDIANASKPRGLGALGKKKKEYISANMDELSRLQQIYLNAGGTMGDLSRKGKIHEYYARIASAKAFLRRINEPNNIEALFDPKNEQRLPVDANQLISVLKNVWDNPEIKNEIISIFQGVVYE